MVSIRCANANASASANANANANTFLLFIHILTTHCAMFASM